MEVSQRMKRLETLYLSGIRNSNHQAVSIETLMDVLVVMFDELCGSNLRREKNITDFVEWGEFIT